MSDSVFNAYSTYYDLLYRDKDYDSEVTYIHNILLRHGIPSGSILEYGSGTGKHGRLLSEKGFRVHGIELSSKMVSNAKISSGFTCEQGDICLIQIARTFEAVLSLFHVVSYLTDNDKIQQLFIRASEHLEKDGIFVFDIWYSPAVYTLVPSTRVKRMEDEKFKVTRIAEPVIHCNENIVDVKYTIFAENLISNEVISFMETHPMRHFSLPEIDIFAKIAGFQRIASEEFLTGKATGSDTWGVCITLKKL